MPPKPTNVQLCNQDLSPALFKKHVCRKHEAQIRQKLRDTGRLSFKSKLEKSVFTKSVLLSLEIKCKQHPSLKCF